MCRAALRISIATLLICRAALRISIATLLVCRAALRISIATLLICRAALQISIATLLICRAALRIAMAILHIPHCVWMGHLHVLISWRLSWEIYPLRPVAKEGAWKGITLFFACHYMKNQKNPQYKTPLSLRACLYPFRKSWICICNSSGG